MTGVQTCALPIFDRATGTIAHRHFRDLPDLVRPADLVVVNAKVFTAREGAPTVEAFEAGVADNVTV